MERTFQRPLWRARCNPLYMTPLVIAGHRSRCRAFTRVGLRETEDTAIRLTHPTVEEIIAVMRVAGDSGDGIRLRALIVILWRAGVRIGEALDLAETDLDAVRGAVLVRHGKGGKRREVGMDRWGKRRDKPAWRRR